VAGVHSHPNCASSHGRLRYHRRFAGRHGFTMVELIIVIVLVGILSALAITRFFDRTVYDTEAATEQLRTILRYGQKVAIAQHRNVFVILGPNSAALCFANEANCAAANQVQAPSGQNSDSAATRAACNARTWMCEGRPNNVAGAASRNITAFGFNALGQPFDINATTFGGLTITLSGSGNTRTVGVAPETGYVF